LPGFKKGMIEIGSRVSPVIAPEAVNAMLKLFKTKLFVTKTAGELISGYEDPLMKMAKTFLPKVIKDDKFSLLNGVSITILK
jgi:hypothetical protein